jgi:phage terminase small subunit
VSVKKGTKKGAAKRRPTRKQEKFVEGVLRHGNATQAARDAGYKHPNVQGAQNLVKLSIQERIEQRREAAMRRAQIHTDVIVGSLVEIAGASLGDVLDENGEFNLQTARENNVDHLLKKVKVTTFDTKDKNGIVTSTRTTHEYEMYSRLDALNQLRDTFGMKQEPRANSQAELESAIQDFIRMARGKGYEVGYEEARSFVEPRLVTDTVQ